MTNTIEFFIIVAGIILAIALFALCNYYCDIFSAIRGDYAYRLGIRTKKDFYWSLIPFQLWIRDWKENFNNLD